MILRAHLWVLALLLGMPLCSRLAAASELLDAIHDQNIGRVSSAIKSGADVNAKDEEGFFPLYYSIAYDSPELTLLLLEAGADVHQKGPRYAMPMIAHAAAIGNMKIVQQLLHYKADPKAKDKFGGTAIEEAAYNGFGKIAKLLTNHGAHSRWPAHVAAGLGDQIKLRKLIPTLDDIDAECPGWKTTPLHFAASGGSHEACKMLLEAGASPSKKNRFGTTPLHLAADAGNVPLVRLLLSKGADPSQRDDDDVVPGQFSQDAEIRRLLERHRRF